MLYRHVNAKKILTEISAEIKLFIDTERKTEKLFVICTKMKLIQYRILCKNIK